MTEPVLSVRNLQVEFKTRHATLRAIDDISFDIAKGEVLGVVGESGAGKSVTGAAVLGLMEPNARVAGGRVIYDHRRVDDLSAEEMRALRGREIAAIFQDPMSSLDPVWSIGDQIMETLCLHRRLNKQAARKEAIALLEKVGIPSAARRVDEYAHQWSGGMLQRAVIALALAGKPKLMLADEPTTALDVTIQDQILSLLLSL